MDDKGENSQQYGVDPLQAPGQVISPGNSSPTPTSAPAGVPPPPPPSTPTAIEQTPPSSFEPAISTEDGTTAPDQLESGTLSWSAPEFVAHDKSGSWYLKLAATTLVVAGLLYLLTSDLISTLMVVVAGIFLGSYARRKPKTTNYMFDDQGIVVGKNQFQYEQFRCFTVIHEGSYITFNLIPLKRFAPPTGMCYEGSEGEKIIGFLSQRLPYEQRKLDLVDSLMQRIRF